MTATGPPSTGRLDALTGLRFVAAAVVLIEHFPQVIPGLGVVAAAQGGAGVSLFFVLSGFVLTYRYGDRFAERTGDLRRYVVARVARIVPLHLLAMAVVVPVVLAIDRPDIGAPAMAAGALANVVLLHAWVPAQSFHVWNGPSWSISVEAFFYAVFPVLVALVVWPAMRRRRLGRTILGVGLVQIVGGFLLLYVAADALLARSADPEGARLIVGRLQQVPALRLGEFVIGCLLGAAYRPEYRSSPVGLWRALESRRARSGLLAVAVVAAAAIQFSPACLAASCGPGSTTAAGLVDLRIFMVYLPLVVITVSAVAWGTSWASRPLASRPMVALGEASYAIYILQWIAWLLINEGAGEPSQLEATGAVAAVLLVALAVNRAVERPIRSLITARWAASTS